MQESLGASSSASENRNDNDDEGESEGCNEEFEAGEGVEEMLRVLEEGGALPDIEGLMEAENSQVLFMALPCPALHLAASALPCPALRPCPTLLCLVSGQCGSVLMHCRTL